MKKEVQQALQLNARLPNSGMERTEEGVIMFTQDIRTESFLTQMGVKFRYTNDLKLLGLPREWDATNQGRPVALRESAIAEYAALMESGSAAPAVIVHERGDHISILDGIQRVAAAIFANFTRYSAYVVTTDSEDTLASIRVLANARLQGHAENPEWTKRNAVQHLIIDRNMSPAEVAHLGGWKAADLERLAKVIDYGFQVRCIGGPQKLPDGMIHQISELTTCENLRRASKPIASFLNAIHKCRFSTDDASPYIEDFFAHATTKNATTLYEERLQNFLGEPEVDVRIHGRSGQGLSTAINLRRAIKTAITITDKAIADGRGLLYVDEYFQLIKKLESRLRKLAPHCKQADNPLTPADKWAEK